MPRFIINPLIKGSTPGVPWPMVVPCMHQLGRVAWLGESMRPCTFYRFDPRQAGPAKWWAALGRRLGLVDEPMMLMGERPRTVYARRWIAAGRLAIRIG